jgi:hypothetical protein
MDLLILGESLEHPSYRGTERRCPGYVDHLPETHPANQAFLWYVYNQDKDAGAGLGLIHDLNRARALIEEYAKLQPPQEFELIELTRGDAQPELATELLGFDVTEFYYHSILNEGLRFFPERHKRTIDADEKFRSIAPLVRLFREHFSAYLNEHMLFRDKPTADFCRDCAAVLTAFTLNVFDIPAESLVVAGLYRVPALLSPKG